MELIYWTMHTLLLVEYVFLPWQFISIEMYWYETSTMHTLRLVECICWPWQCIQSEAQVYARFHFKHRKMVATFTNWYHKSGPKSNESHKTEARTRRRKKFVDLFCNFIVVHIWACSQHHIESVSDQFKLSTTDLRMGPSEHEWLAAS